MLRFPALLIMSKQIPVYSCQVPLIVADSAYVFLMQIRIMASLNQDCNFLSCV